MGKTKPHYLRDEEFLGGNQILLEDMMYSSSSLPFETVAKFVNHSHFVRQSYLCTLATTPNDS